MVSSDMFQLARSKCVSCSAAENAKIEDRWLQLRLGSTSSGSFAVTKEVGLNRNRSRIEPDSSSGGRLVTLQLFPAKASELAKEFPDDGIASRPNSIFFVPSDAPQGQAELFLPRPPAERYVRSRLPNVDMVFQEERLQSCSRAYGERGCSTEHQSWKAAEGRSGAPPPSSAKIRRVQSHHERRRAAVVGFPPLAPVIGEYAALAGETQTWNQLATEPFQALVRRFSTSLHVQGSSPPRLGGGAVFCRQIGEESSFCREPTVAAQQRRRPSTPSSSAAPHTCYDRRRLRLASSPASRGHAAGIWFSLEASHAFQGDDQDLPSMGNMYMRVRNGEMPISTVKKYLMRKLGLSSEQEILD